MEESIPNLLGHIGYICLALGTFLVARKIGIGWLFRISGEVFWFVAGVMLGMSSIWFWCSFFLCLDIYGYFNWKKAQIVEAD